MIIGITGLIGSGKTEAAREFCKQGAVLIDADKIGKEVVENNQDILYRLVLEFGGDILTKGKKLDRGKLGLLAFSSPLNTEKLNSIVHPMLLKTIDIKVSNARSKNKHAVIDAALLVNWNYHKKIDITILVSAKESVRIKRLTQRGLSAEEIKQRSNSQLSLSYLQAQSDIVITNNNDLNSLQIKSRDIFHKLIKKG